MVRIRLVLIISHQPHFISYPTARICWSGLTCRAVTSCLSPSSTETCYSLSRRQHHCVMHENKSAVRYNVNKQQTLPINTSKLNQSDHTFQIGITSFSDTLIHWDTLPTVKHLRHSTNDELFRKVSNNRYSTYMYCIYKRLSRISFDLL